MIYSKCFMGEDAGLIYKLNITMQLVNRHKKKVNWDIKMRYITQMKEQGNLATEKERDKKNNIIFTFQGKCILLLWYV